MSEYIGSRISLISKSDIRYVGTLHEISSAESTVALENVTSYGTEGRRGNPEEEIPPSDNVYEYIVFRGSDVKNLNIEEPAPKENKPLNRQCLMTRLSLALSVHPTKLRQDLHPNFGQPSPYSPYGPYPPFAGRGYGPQPGFPGGPGNYGYGMPYGAPPGWYPPPPPGHGMPGQGMPNQPFPGRPGPFPPQSQGPIGPPGQHQQQQVSPALNDSQVNKDTQPNIPPATPEPEAAPKPVETQASSQPIAPAPIAQPKQAPPPPVESKPDVAAALAPPPAPVSASTTAPAPVPGMSPSAGAKPTPTGPKSNRIIPAVPLPGAGNKAAAPPKASATQQQPATSAPAAPQAQPNPIPPAATAVKAAQQAAQLQSQTAAQQAAAAVAAAMAKLGPAPGQPKPQTQTKQDGDAALQNLTNKVNEMRMDDRIRHSRQQGTGGYAAGHRGAGRGRGRGRGDHPQGQPRRESQSKVEVPTTDYDFESANAKFNKQDLVKEAIATGSPLGTPADEDVRSPVSGHPESMNGTGAPAAANGTSTAAEDVVVPPPAHGYNKAASFFDNISSEIRDREDAASQNRRLGGQEFRTEERRKNLETFGQGSVDGMGGYRGGFRGRGRGRGFGRGRGGYGRGGGAFRGRGESGQEAGEA
ncbi:hypothetical protein H2199_005184 [Coniosporium tulheliwenetii]|uniref:Uncharacterized protein n=1 Tax=Coniosporium tulheliwenetii TaxID=3383036 RepID=A0ACC2Z353_9PEZI|nr:hypothetical protein H2199_005184 [Cladosporium sp. JES 115]